MLAPGRSIKLTFDVGHQRFAREDLPLRYLVDVTYTDGKKRRFKDPAYPLDLTPYKHSAVDPMGLPELVENRKRFARNYSDGPTGAAGSR